MDTERVRQVRKGGEMIQFYLKVFIDGNMWCALYGDDLQSGVAGFGETISDAIKDFEANWIEEKHTEGNK